MRHMAFCMMAAVMVTGAGMTACADANVFVAPSSIPREMIARINRESRTFAVELESILASDGDGLLELVDKTHPLAADAVPGDLVALGSGRSYVPGKSGMALRARAEAALEKMAAAARKDGVTLVASSAYRSFDYQKKVYERIVGELGQAAADRESARPGTSQHQTGCAVDFGSITDDFAGTAAGKWLAANAGSYGWSLSFPDGYEAVTGYRWECWHFRYIGVPAASFQKKWFGDTQQYMLEFIDAWKAQGTER